MHSFESFLAVASFLVSTSLAQPPSSAAEVLAFEHASVITCEVGAAVLDDTTVLVGDGHILSLQPSASAKLPDGATRIDARGKFLVPGFTDMHCHLLSDDKIADEFADEELAVIVANGVTTIRDPIGKSELLLLRAKVAKGEVLGPTLFVGSPQVSGRSYGAIFNGVVVKDAETARAAVRRFQREGYDGIKLTLAITPEVFDAVIATAAEVHIPVFGHVGPAVGLPRALAAGMQIEHMDQFIEALLPDDSKKRESLSDTGIYRNWDTLDLLDEKRIPALVQSVVREKVWTTPTNAFFVNAFARGWSDAEIDASPDARFVSRDVRADLRIGRDQFATRVNPPEAQRERYVHLRYEMVRQLHEAGGRILVGSDSPESMLLGGFTLHRELGHLVAAGVPSRAALEAATRSPAEWLGKLASSGTIAAGKVADLVLLAKDPLEDIDNTRSIEGVMLRGKWLARSDLDRLLENSAAVLSKAPLRAELGGK